METDEREKLADEIQAALLELAADLDARRASVMALWERARKHEATYPREQIEGREAMPRLLWHAGVLRDLAAGIEESAKEAKHIATRTDADLRRECVAAETDITRHLLRRYVDASSLGRSVIAERARMKGRTLGSLLAGSGVALTLSRLFDVLDVLDVPPCDFFAALYGVEEHGQPN